MCHLSKLQLVTYATMKGRVINVCVYMCVYLYCTSESTEEVWSIRLCRIANWRSSSSSSAKVPPLHWWCVRYFSGTSNASWLILQISLLIIWQGTADGITDLWEPTEVSSDLELVWCLLFSTEEIPVVDDVVCGREGRGREEEGECF